MTRDLLREKTEGDVLFAQQFKNVANSFAEASWQHAYQRHAKTKSSQKLSDLFWIPFIVCGEDLTHGLEKLLIAAKEGVEVVFNVI